jgi:glycerophosphoryl diester phosphodiesterase
MRRWPLILGLAGLVLVGLYLNNASWLAHPGGRLTILAHRGLHQTYGREGLTSQTCTAARIDPPVHAFLENTVPSIASAFRLGADSTELDIHPTTDGDFAVFHDWTLDCRTNGHGRTRDHSMAELKALDIGWGYTDDGGKTFPLRGKGQGLTPSLGEVLSAFPDRRFLVNIKSDDPHEGDLIDAWLTRHREVDPKRLSFYGGQQPVDRLHALRPGLRTMTKASTKACLLGYLVLGWSGYTPAACRHTIVFVPANYHWVLWGWPDRFLARLKAADSEVYLSAAADLKVKTLVGFDDPAQLKALPRNWRGGVFTDRIDRIGPALRPAR